MSSNINPTDNTDLPTSSGPRLAHPTIAEELQMPENNQEHPGSLVEASPTEQPRSTDELTAAEALLELYNSPLEHRVRVVEQAMDQAMDTTVPEEEKEVAVFPTVHDFTAINAQKQEQSLPETQVPCSGTPSLVTSTQVPGTTSLLPADMTVLEEEKYLIDFAIALKIEKETEYRDAGKEGSQERKDKKNQLPEQQIARLKAAGRPHLFHCEYDLLPGCPPCNSQQGYLGPEFARTCVSHFFGWNVNEWKQIPTRHRVFMCRKHYQTGAYNTQSAKAASGDGREFAYLQLPLIRSQVNHIEAWRGDAARFEIGNSTAMQERVVHYRKLVSEGQTSEAAAAKVDSMRNGEFDHDGKKAQKAQKKKASKLAAQSNFNDEQALEDLADAGDDEGAMEVDSLNVDTGPAIGKAGSSTGVAGPAKKSRQRKAGAIKTESNAKGKEKEKSADGDIGKQEEGDEDEGDDNVNTGEDGSAPQTTRHNVKIEEKTPITWLLDFLARFGGLNKTISEVRTALDSIEADVRSSVLTALPAVSFLPNSVVADGLVASKKDRYKKEKNIELKRTLAAIRAGADEADQGQAAEDLDGKKVLPKAKGKSKALPKENGKGKGKRKTVDVEDDRPSPTIRLNLSKKRPVAESESSTPEAKKAKFEE